ncbi:hypothetical protein GGI43DRAFT_401396 [Trichoderma evansii]
MRSATFATILGFAVYGTQAGTINLPGWQPIDWPSYWPSYWSNEWPDSWPINWFDEWFGSLDQLPENPCEWVGGSCDAITHHFCHAKHDIQLGLPCSLEGLVGVGCCYHDPQDKKKEEEKMKKEEADAKKTTTN